MRLNVPSAFKLTSTCHKSWRTTLAFKQLAMSAFKLRLAPSRKRFFLLSPEETSAVPWGVATKEAAGLTCEVGRQTDSRHCTPASRRHWRSRSLRGSHGILKKASTRWKTRKQKRQCSTTRPTRSVRHDADGANLLQNFVFFHLGQTPHHRPVAARYQHSHNGAPNTRARIPLRLFFRESKCCLRHFLQLQKTLLVTARPLANVIEMHFAGGGRAQCNARHARLNTHMCIYTYLYVNSSICPSHMHHKYTDTHFPLHTHRTVTAGAPKVLSCLQIA